VGVGPQQSACFKTEHTCLLEYELLPSTFKERPLLSEEFDNSFDLSRCYWVRTGMQFVGFNKVAIQGFPNSSLWRDRCDNFNCHHNSVFSSASL
jgi:hypothetical protein